MSTFKDTKIGDKVWDFRYDWFKNLFKDKHYRDGLYIGSTKEFRAIYLEAEQHLLNGNRADAIVAINKLQLYIVTSGDEAAIRRLLSVL